MSDETERLCRALDARYKRKLIMDNEAYEAKQHMRALQAKVDRLTSRGLHDLHWENDELKARVKELEKEVKRTAINIIFDGPPSHESGRFVEVENDAGASISVGSWIERSDGLWSLRIEELPQ